MRQINVEMLEVLNNNSPTSHAFSWIKDEHSLCKIYRNRGYTWELLGKGLLVYMGKLLDVPTSIVAP